MIVLTTVDETEVSAALKAARDTAERKVLALQARIAKARATITKSEDQLRRVRTELQRRVDAITRSYVSESGAMLPEPTKRPRARKWSLDEPVLKMILGMSAPVFTIPDVVQEWNRQNPHTPLGRTSVRLILDRLDKRVIEVANPGGQGRKNLREYRLRSINLLPAEHSEEASTH